MEVSINRGTPKMVGSERGKFHRGVPLKYRTPPYQGRSWELLGNLEMGWWFPLIGILVWGVAKKHQPAMVPKHSTPVVFFRHPEGIWKKIGIDKHIYIYIYVYIYTRTHTHIIIWRAYIYIYICIYIIYIYYIYIYILYTYILYIINLYLNIYI